MIRRNMKKDQLEENRTKLYEKLKKSGWDKLKGFILSSDFDKIILALEKDVDEGKRFTPVLKQVFRAFEECNYGDLKVVVVGQDPYYQLGVAAGMAFDCSNTGVIQKSLMYIYQEVERTIYNNEGYNRDPDLKHWANQGVLLINTALTTTLGKVGTHYEIWKPFMLYLIDMLNSYNPGLVYVFMGAKAQEWSDVVSDLNYKLKVSHPASAAYQKLSTWNSDGVFLKVNELLMKSNGMTIKW